MDDCSENVKDDLESNRYLNRSSPETGELDKKDIPEEFEAMPRTSMRTWYKFIKYHKKEYLKLYRTQIWEEVSWIPL